MRTISLLLALICLSSCLLYAQDSSSAALSGSSWANLPSDVTEYKSNEPHKFASEIANALELGYLNKDSKGLFNPDGGIKTQDYLGCVKKAAAVLGITNIELPKPQKPADIISKQDAIKLLVESLLTPQQITNILLNTGSPKDYLGDFMDSSGTSPATDNAIAIAVYKGWIPDKEKLWSDKPANRAYACALLTRAAPNPNGYTGLAVVWNGEPPERTMYYSFGCYKDDKSFDLLYPDLTKLPSFSYIEAPGVISYCKTVEEAKERRVGVNPLVVEAQNVVKAKNGGYNIVLSPEDVAKIHLLDAKWLFVKAWRVAIIIKPKV